MSLLQGRAGDLCQRRARATAPCLVLLSLWVVECGARADHPVPSSPDNQAGWRLTFHVSGGFAGFDRQLELTSTGTATATDNRRKRQVAGQATRDELQVLDRLAMSAASTTAPNRTSCRDCFEYAIDLRLPGKSVMIRARDEGLADSGAAPLVRILTRLLDRLLTEP